jgi:general secretion pathway protein I
LFHLTLRPISSSRGFTLIEALVALTVMMIVLSAIAGLSASSVRADRYVEHRLTDLETAQEIIAGLPARNELANAALTGEMAGYRWRLDAKPFDAAFVHPRARTPWTPQMMTVTIRGPGGAPLSFDMVRLVRADKQ